MAEEAAESRRWQSRVFCPSPSLALRGEHVDADAEAAFLRALLDDLKKGVPSSTMARGVREVHGGVPCAAIVLLKPRSILKTTSGKLRRAAIANRETAQANRNSSFGSRRIGT